MMSDKASQSNYISISTQHLDLVWTLDIEQRTLSGSCTHTLVAHQHEPEEAVFDTSYLDIAAVHVNGSRSDYTLDQRLDVVGQALHVPLPLIRKGQSVTVKIDYATTSKCTATGWLEKAQTGSGKYVSVYTQCQAIHCRSIIPCQDTPAVKATYTASVKSSIPFFMSALRTKPAPSSTFIHTGSLQEFTFEQRVPIPSYLIALVAGDFVYKKLGDRVGVYAEPHMIDGAAWEFEQDISKFLDIGEQLTSPYEFSQCDMVVLPASFPFGGMENPSLTTLAPSVVAGDRSNVDVVAHEIMHNWFGNNIGCADWSHFWLNEGWTTYSERLLLREMHGEPARGLSFIQGAKALADDLKKYEGRPEFQQLVIPYKLHEDPDEAFSGIPYDKGANLLLHIERVVGGLKNFKPYMKAYVSKFRGQSITTWAWKDHLYSYFEKHHGPAMVVRLDTIDWDAWFHGAGLELPVKMEYDTSLADKSYELAVRWEGSRAKEELDFDPKDIEDFTSGQTVVFLERLLILNPEPLPAKLISQLDKLYSFESSQSSEIKLRFYTLALDSNMYVQEAANWVATQGRMKYCRPIFQLLKSVDEELAKKTFRENEAFYHPIAANLIRKDLYG